MESQETEFSIDSSALYANEDNSSTTSSGNSTAVTALEELQELFTTDPNTERVSFRGRKFSQTEAEAALTFVQTHFPRLRHLDLRDNDLYELPRDFASSAVSTLSTAVPTEAFLQQLKAVVKAFHECDSLGKTNNNSKVKLFSQLDRHVELLAQQLKRQEPDDGKTELSEAMLQTRWSLLELLDLIHCVYASKVKYDDRAITAGAPRETIEQHLYTYLNTRFGLPKLIVDYASAVWKAAEHFARRENDAAVFVALLRNRLDEGFLDIKRKLQSAIVELLRAFFTARHPKKQGKAIAALVQNRMDDLLQEEEWRNLLTYLYEPQDSATLLRLVQQKAEKYQTLQLQRQKPQPNEKPSLALPFTDFEQVLYGYQLQGRLDLLDNFRRAFEELDTDRVGVIGRPECAVTKLVETLDPFNHDVITFSDAANALLPDIRRANTKTDSTTTSQSKIKKITS
ncbi:hypothetical protein JM16_002653 [Phytophthora kernoviae]|uniref:EF-hand domain-containing protein n=1 Tax=Phytophthora kernoviae TaxID=325452 RepID=A0A8T0M4K6_9STRA|nr:hypothetical protein JM16_002653 [Phytophthora kernoviae]